MNNLDNKAFSRLFKQANDANNLAIKKNLFVSVDLSYKGSERPTTEHAGSYYARVYLCIPDTDGTIKDFVESWTLSDVEAYIGSTPKFNEPEKCWFEDMEKVFDQVRKSIEEYK